jgi:CubicO group peptidase (beta-lactamase class C family)
MIAAAIRAAHAEALKLKRTLALWMVVVAPLLVGLLGFFVETNHLSRGTGVSPKTFWDMLSRESLAIWAIFLLPLLIALETALLAGIEHGERQWKHLFALPVPRASIFAAKYLVTQAIAFFSTLMVCVLIVMSGLLLVAMFPKLATAGPPPLVLICTRAFYCWLASGLILSAHLWIALRWPGFTIALGAGVTGTFFALFAASARIGKFYPWLFPVNSFNPQATDRNAVALWLGIGGGLLVAIAAAIDFVRREESAPPTLGRKSIAVWAAIGLAFAALAMSLQKAPEPGRLSGRIQRIEKGLLQAASLDRSTSRAGTLAERMKQYGVPGVAVTVIRNREIEWTRSYGVKAAGSPDPVTSETRFQAASISKPITAMAALALVQQNLLSLDEDVNLRLKSWRVPPSALLAKQKVTLHRLLNHSAGLAAFEMEGYPATQPLPSLPALLPSIVRIDGEPGGRFQYSNAGYALIQQLMEDAAGRPFPQLMQELVLSKLEMKASAFSQPPAAEWNQACARGHKPDSSLYPGGWRNHAALGAGGLWTTSTDLAKFVTEIQKSLRGESNRVLNREMTRLMTTRLTGDYGLGIELTSDGFQHGGATPGYRCLLRALSESGDGVVIMTNGDGGAVLLTELLRSIEHEYGWAVPKQTKRQGVPIEAWRLRDFEGRYEAGGAVMVISVDEGKLWIESSAVPGQRWELLPVGADKFLLVEENQEVQFKRSSAGAVIELRVDQGGQPFVGRRTGN